jgi:hypothetical protein
VEITPFSVMVNVVLVDSILKRKRYVDELTVKILPFYMAPSHPKTSVYISLPFLALNVMGVREVGLRLRG